MALMNKYNIKSEGELISGCIRKYNKLHKRRQHDLSQEVKRQYREIRATYRTHFFGEILCLAKSDKEQHQLDDAEDETDSNYDYNVGTSNRICLGAQNLKTNIERSFNDYKTLEGGEQKEEEIVVLQEEEENDDDDDDDDLEWVEKVATSTDFISGRTCPSEDLNSSIRIYAWKLAATYYMASYSPKFRQNEVKHSRGSQLFVLFSFPWIVADVIYSGLRYHQDQVESKSQNQPFLMKISNVKEDC